MFPVCAQRRNDRWRLVIGTQCRQCGEVDAFDCRRVVRANTRLGLETSIHRVAELHRVGVVEVRENVWENAKAICSATWNRRQFNTYRRC